ncbi:HNH endonuclease signature motif containing protein [Tardiphaga sp. 619_E2_N8_5]|uniref:HNH endonuclease signature motif containing protein n=1 Tax=unclassified Tardiphaga TaxID=2631404 RepID=UPI003F246393
MRVTIPDDIAAEVMFLHMRTCCVCTLRERAVQIHHIDDDPSNNSIENLAVLCLQDHENTQVRGGFGRKLRATEVLRNRDDWLRRVSERRAAADKAFVAETVAANQEVSHNVDVEWLPPSLHVLEAQIESLPDTRRYIYLKARPLWSSPVRPDMLEGTSIVIDVVEQMFLRLAQWFPPQHFGGKGASEFFAELLADRHIWNAALSEPLGWGTAGREARIIAYGGTMKDMERALVELVQTLCAHHLDELDFEAWHSRWNAAAGK